MTQPAEVDPLYAAATAGFLLGFIPALLIVGMRRELDPITYSERITYLSVLGVLFLFALEGIVQHTDHGAQAMAELTAHWDDIAGRLRLLPALLPALWAGVVTGRFFGFRSRTKHQRTGRMSLLNILREQLGYRPLPPVPWAPRLGRLIRWDDQRGFGFIRPDHQDVAELFVHVRAFRGRRRPQAGQRIRFTTAVRDGDAHAATASILGFAVVPATIAVALVVTGVVLTIAVNLHSLLVTGTLLHSRMFVAILAMSLLTFHVYRVDLHRARLAAWRVPEWRLHFLELLGGWPGALVAQWYYRHKLTKRSYQVVYWLIPMVYLAAFWILDRPQLDAITPRAH